ncbi:hypothetical protein BO86DRAFT_349940 [Aspergillus japonicus CBS 114.51]|uniref:MARVEL domain-containing protein n=2 Tax=Aspergillus TaxID=5052 RepID=A0A2V5HH18_ASPV1|nr:hypothetical protein BO86DRAFT_349940 [Aspergillus japonicus CBS 114.51]PYI23728.1 hypothetical protein BO99DRAFT_470371 [Aspergillus violaceofuscus CBS 115571]RAH76192.1 hypothetical protein BO86DRAFT_349940 [Aspergillus japonicus CBS 114.51]
MGVGGVILRFANLAIRILQFLAAAVILGIFSYFLAVLARHDQTIPQWMKAVEGLSGAATLYGILGILLTCCLGGVTFFAAVAVLLDVCFIGAMIAIAIMTRKGTQSCSGHVDTPLGSGASNTDDANTHVRLGYACVLEKASFAVAIIGIFLFLISILFQVLLARHHKREKRFGPSPANGYTYGTGTQRRGFFWRRNKNNPETASADDMLPSHPAPRDVELGSSPTEKTSGTGGLFTRNKHTAPEAAAPPGYGYGNSAYSANY